MKAWTQDHLGAHQTPKPIQLTPHWLKEDFWVNKFSKKYILGFENIQKFVFLI